MLINTMCVAAFPVLAEVPFEISPEKLALSPYAWMVGIIYLGLFLSGLGVDILMLARLEGFPFKWPQRSDRLKARAWPNFDVGKLAFWLLFLHLSGMILISIMYTFNACGEDDQALLVVIQSIIFHWAGLALVFAMLKRRRIGWKTAFGLKWRDLGRSLGRGVFYYLAIIPVLLAAGLFTQYIYRMLGKEPGMQEIGWVVSGQHIWWLKAYMIFLTVVLAPVFEEVLFRGVGLPWLAKRVGTLWAVIILSSFFAVMHFHMGSVLPLFVIAVSFSLAYIYTGSLLVPMVMHAIFNGINISMLIILQGVAGG